MPRGPFRFVVAAQRFTSTMERTVAYLNEVAPQSRFYAVELVRFESDGASAFEARTVLKPEMSRVSTRQRAALDEAAFLGAMGDSAYREAVERLFDTARAQGLRFEWGTTGTSIRLPTRDRPEPITIGWVFPPGGIGWMGLSYITLGYDKSSAQKTPSVLAHLEEYARDIGRIPGVRAPKSQLLTAYTLEPDIAIQYLDATLDAITRLVEATSGA